MPACSLPKIPYFRDWYNREFKDLCLAHDYEYAHGHSRKVADIHLMIGLAHRGYPVLAIWTYIFVRAFGWTHYKP